MSYAKTLVLQNFQLVNDDFEQMVDGFSVHTDPAEVFSGTDLVIVWVPYITKGDRPAEFSGLASWWARVDTWKKRLYMDVRDAARRREQAASGEIAAQLLGPEKRAVAAYLRNLSPEAWERSELVQEALGEMAGKPEAVTIE